MVSSFYPATIYAQQDAKNLVWELEKENHELKKQKRKQNLIRDCFEKEIQKLNQEIDILKFELQQYKHKTLKEFEQ